MSSLLGRLVSPSLSASPSPSPLPALSSYLSLLLLFFRRSNPSVCRLEDVLEFGHDLLLLLLALFPHLSPLGHCRRVAPPQQQRAPAKLHLRRRTQRTLVLASLLLPFPSHSPHPPLPHPSPVPLFLPSSFPLFPSSPLPLFSGRQLFYIRLTSAFSLAASSPAMASFSSSLAASKQSSTIRPPAADPLARSP